MTKPRVPAPGFVKRIGPIVDERRRVEFRALASAELVNRLSDKRLPTGWTTTRRVFQEEVQQPGSNDIREALAAHRARSG